MVDASQAPDQPPSPAIQEDPQALCSFWQDEIMQAERKNKKFITRGKQIIKRYKNERTVPVQGIPLGQRRMNVLWSNIQTLKPVIFSQTPKANVSRRNKSNKDPVGRTAAIVLQNVLQNSLGMEDFSFIMGQVVEDRLLPGQGLAIVEYKPQVEQDEVGWQAAETRYIHWQDWLTNIARVPQEVWWWAYVSFLTRDEVYRLVLDATGDEQLATEVKQEIILDHREEKSTRSDERSKAVVWTVWDSSSKRVLHIATGYKKAPLAIMPPPVNFDGFFPGPRPLTSTTSTDSTRPVPDFDQYVDQADEIDTLTQRIALLARALRLRGFYPADMESIKTLMENGTDNDLVPVSNWAMFAERGGADKVIGWVPIKDVAATLAQCIEARREAIEIMYEVTGISDVMRGATEASETATAQQLKAQFGGIRVRESQKDCQRFIRDILRRKAEVISEHFELPVLQAMSGVKLLTEKQKRMVQMAVQVFEVHAQQAQMAQQQGLPVPPPPGIPQPPPEMVEALKEPSWEQVMALLRDEKLRGFVVDVETDSTIEPDQQAQQQAAVEFVSAVTQYITAWAQVLPAMPQAAPLAGEMLTWAVRQWKGADTIEGEIDELVEQMKKAAQQPKPPGPEQVRAEAEVKKADASVQVAQIGVEKAKLDLVGDQVRHQQDMQQMAFQAANPPPQQQNGGPPA